MTVENTHCVVSYDGNGVRTEFPTTFRFLDEAHLVVEASADDGVTWTALVLGDDYDVDGAGAVEPGGTVTTTVPVANGTTLRITRDTTIDQLNSFRATGSLPVATIETSFDKLTMIAQEERCRLEQLEALGDLVTVADLANGVVVEGVNIAVDPDAPEEEFPQVLAATGGVSAKHLLLTRIYNLADPDERIDGVGPAQWKPGPGANQVTLQYIPGLTPGVTYVCNFLVLL